MNYKKLLLELNFNVNSIGFEYWLKAIEIYNKNKNKYTFNMMILYSDIAKSFDTNYTKVERALRFAREKANKNIHIYFNYYGKITNKSILKLLSEV